MSTSDTLSSALSFAINYLKPYRTEALIRIRTNAICLLGFSVLTYLLPVPSIVSAIRQVLVVRGTEEWERELIYSWFCMFETTFALLFVFNILHAGFSLRYPRASHPPVASPMKKGNALTSPVTKRPMSILGTSPTVNRPSSPFSKSPLLKSVTSPSLGMKPAGLPSSTYAQTPQTSPSRTIHYSLSGMFTNSTSTLGSSAPSTPSPSPIVNAYRGKHTSDGIGRSLDGSFLNRLTQSINDED